MHQLKKALLVKTCPRQHLLTLRLHIDTVVAESEAAEEVLIMLQVLTERFITLNSFLIRAADFYIISNGLIAARSDKT